MTGVVRVFGYCVYVFEPHDEMRGRVVVRNFDMSSFRMHLYLAQVCGDEVRV